jgi:hypothetical protein
LAQGGALGRAGSGRFHLDRLRFGEGGRGGDFGFGGLSLRLGDGDRFGGCFGSRLGFGRQAGEDFLERNPFFGVNETGFVVERHEALVQPFPQFGFGEGSKRYPGDEDLDFERRRRGSLFVKRVGGNHIWTE